MKGATLPLCVANWAEKKSQAMQETLGKAYEARMGLIAQQQDMVLFQPLQTYVSIWPHHQSQETELVKEEFDTIEDDGRHGEFALANLTSLIFSPFGVDFFCSSFFSSNSW